MTTYGLRHRIRPDVVDRSAVAALILVPAWTLVAVNSVVGAFTPPVPYLAALVLLVPVALAGTIAFGRRPATPAIRFAALWTSVIAAALVGGVLLSTQPLLAIAVPVVIVSAMLCARYPAGAVGLTFFLTGTSNTLEAFTPIPVGETVDIVLAGLWTSLAWTLLLGRRERRVWIWPGVVVSSLYLVASVVAILGAESLFSGLYAFRVSGWYMLAFLLMAYAGWGAETYRRITFAVVGIALLVGAYATFRWFVGPADAERDIALAVAPKYEFVNDTLRVFGSFPNGKDLAAWSAALIPFCVAFALTIRSRWTIVAVAGAGLCTVGLLGSETRAGFLALIAGLGVVLVLYQLSRGVPGLHLGVTAAAVVGILGVGVFLFSQTAGSNDASADRYAILVTAPTEDPAYQARLFKWRTAVREIRTHPLGHGLGSAGRAHARYGRFQSIASGNIDNSYLTIAFQQGFAVMTLFITALVLLLVGLARRVIFTRDPEKAGIAMGACGALASLIVMMYSGNFVEGLTALTVWIVFGLGVAQFATLRTRPDERAAG